MASNGISTLATKELKQVAKLDLSQALRKGQTVTSGSGSWSTDGVDNPALNRYRDNNEYDIDLLPTKYVGNTVFDNPNLGGLGLGRPWANIVVGTPVIGLSLSAGAYERTYNSYYGDTGTVNGATSADVDEYNTWLTTRTETAGNVVNSISRSGTVANYTSYTAAGYFLAPASGNFTFYINSDDGSYFWIGPSALTVPQVLTEAVVQNGTLHGAGEKSGTFSLQSGEYYPIFALFGNLTGPGTAVFSYSSTDAGIAKTTDFTGRLFYNTTTNGH